MVIQYTLHCALFRDKLSMRYQLNFLTIYAKSFKAQRPPNTQSKHTLQNLGSTRLLKQFQLSKFQTLAALKAKLHIILQIVDAGAAWIPTQTGLNNASLYTAIFDINNIFGNTGNDKAHACSNGIDCTKPFNHGFEALKSLDKGNGTAGSAGYGDGNFDNRDAANDGDLRVAA